MKNMILVLRSFDWSWNWMIWLVVYFNWYIHNGGCSLVKALHPLCILICFLKMDLSSCYLNHNEMVLNRHTLWILESILRNWMCICGTNRNNIILFMPHTDHLDLQSLYLLFPSFLIKTIYLVGSWSNRRSVPYYGSWHCNERNKRRNF